MKKSLLFFICLLFISLSSRAQEWNFSSSAFNALGDIITTTTIDGLTIYAASDKVVTVDASAKSIHGIDFTNRLKLGGAGNLSAGLPVSRVLTFPVGGPVTISIALQSSSSSADRELCLVSSVSGDTLHIFPAPGAVASWEEYSYTGGIDTLYLLSKASGINIYYIKSEVVVEPAPEGILTGGNMENATAWSVASWEATVAAEPTYTFNYTTDVPVAGAGGCLRIQAENPGTGSGSVNSMCYQQVTLEPGETYTFSGAFKDITPDSVSNFWCEIGLSKTDPSVAEGRTVTFFTGMNTWDGCGAGLNGTFQDDNCKYTGSFTVPEDGTAEATYYLVILTGQWNNVADHFDVLLDQLSLTKVYDPNVLKKGNMEVASAWSVASWEATVVAEPTYTFNYTTDVPKEGADGCLRIQAENPGTGSGSVNSMCYQQVTLEAGETYTFSGAFKDITPDSVSNFWCEVGLSKTDPSVAEGRTVTFFMGMNTWDGCGAGLNGTFQDDNCKYTGTFTVPADPAGEVTYYFVILTGQWNNVADHFDVLLDQLSLTKYVPVVETWTELPVENVVFGAVDSPEDFTGNVSLKWDVDSLYMIFDVVDDSIVTKGNAYQVDNIEIYFDMDNSKNIHWPRNGGWLKSIDDAYDLNDYQLRLVPGVSFGVNNKVRPTSASIDSTGCNQVYMKTDSGYKFELTVPWETLLPGFDATAGKLFGFDVLWSDNDATATDANRNQITWNSPTDRTFNDPSLFGVLQLTPSGSFTSVLDTEKPSNPTNLVAVATGSNVLLTWDASTDNRVVQSYILFDKTTAVDTILAVKTGNKFTFKNLTAGSHRFGVTAVDVYGNKSSKTSTDNFTVSVNNLAKSRIQLYPNPTTGVVNISADDSKLTNLSVYNVVGELVRSVEFTKSLTLDLSANLKGVYFLHLTSDGNTQISKLIIK